MLFSPHSLLFLTWRLLPPLILSRFVLLMLTRNILVSERGFECVKLSDLGMVSLRERRRRKREKKRERGQRRN